jgi:lipopolysaccharide transport system ATP-binding protein
MPAPVISVEHLSKRYLVGHRTERTLDEQYPNLRDMLERTLRNSVRKAVDIVRVRQIVQGDEVEEFWALKDVSFEVQEGEVLGIIGRNGAGKSTLLKILSRITEPTLGRVTLRGRVASLLEVGTGFHPELTGRENIYLNGAILGMNRAEIRKKFDEIVAFAEVETFLDTPVKRYSSGMYVRLAFAVAAHLEPEILVVDEVLAVGDAEFQKKCLGKMNEVSHREGRTVLFVSHNMRAVTQLTDRAILLSRGSIAHEGRAQSVVQSYLGPSPQRGIVEFDLRDEPRRFEGTGAARILSLRFSRSAPVFEFNEPLSYRIEIKAERKIHRVRANMTIYTRDGTPAGCCDGTELAGLTAGETREMTVTLPPCRLSPGSYYCAVSIGEGDRFTGLVEYDIVRETLFFDVMPEKNEFGISGIWSPDWGTICFGRMSAAWEAPPVSGSAALDFSRV